MSGVTLTKNVKDLYHKNFKSLKKLFGEVIREWIDLPWSWISWINMVKVTMLLKGMYRFNTILIKIIVHLFTDLEKTILKFLWKNKIPEYLNIMYNIRTSRGITIPDFKIYYKTIVIKTNWYWYKTDRLISVNLDIYGHLTFDKKKQNYTMEKSNIFNK